MSASDIKGSVPCRAARRASIRFAPHAAAPCLAAVAMAIVCLAGCGGGSHVDTGPSYNDLVSAGWTAYSAHDFPTATENFTEAAGVNDSLADAFTGLGWVGIRTGNPAAADSAFELGSGRAGIAPVRADLFAGWAFASGALADPTGASTQNYRDSNARADSALGISPQWVMEYDSGIDKDDLHVLKAENDFLLGDYAASLAIVQTFDSSFTADTSTPEGRAALSSEIETLAGDHLSLARHTRR